MNKNLNLKERIDDVDERYREVKDQINQIEENVEQLENKKEQLEEERSRIEGEFRTLTQLGREMGVIDKNGNVIENSEIQKDVEENE